jgi:16S rRNA (cytidine1402-2'-O)-methyltransferase
VTAFRARGRLVLVATPIGNLGDLSPRAREVLAAADVVACEDTRRTGLLLRRLGLGPRRLLSLHAHNEAARIEEVATLLDVGALVALVSDAGMPGVSDPGERLVAALAERGATISAVPGPSAAVAALAVSGLSAGRFVFEGFLPRKGRSRRARLEAIARCDAPSVCYEAPTRVAATLADLAAACGDARRVAVVRELTKLHEEVWRGTLGEAVRRWAEAPTRGEHVIVVGAAPPPAAPNVDDLRDAVLEELAAGCSPRDAAAAAAARLGVSRREAYALAVGAGVGWRRRGGGAGGR